MTAGFLDFLKRSARQGDQVTVEGSKVEGSKVEASNASRWALESSALFERPSKPALATRAKFIARHFCASALGLALLGSAGIWAQRTVAPALDRTLRAEIYTEASQIAAQARAAGFAEASGAEVFFGSDSFSQTFEDIAHHRDPHAHPELGVGSHASIKTSYFTVGELDINPMPDGCSIRLGSNAKGALLSEAKADTRFVTLHELSHCDAMGGSWARFSPSSANLSADQARAMRLILLADSASEAQQGEALSSALTERARADDPAQSEQWSELGIGLFRESVADARALLILSRLEPKTWRATGWELWLQRAAGRHGATWLTPHNHATEEAVSMILSTPDEALARLSPKGVDELSAQAASDALVIKLAKQGWHERYSAELLPQALNAALEKVASVPASSARWASGELSAFGGSLAQTRSDRAWLASPQGAAAVSGLISRMSELSQQGQSAKTVERMADGQLVRYAIEPSVDGLDLRYEGAWRRSSEAAWLASAALLRHAIEKGSASGFKTPQEKTWRDVELLSAGPYSEVLKELRSPKLLKARAGKPTFFGHNEQTGQFVMAKSLESLAKLEGRPAPELPQLNLANRRSLQAPQPTAGPSPSSPKL